MEISRVDLSDLQELAEYFSQLAVVDLVNVKTNESTLALPLPEGSSASHNPPPDEMMCESGDLHTNASPALGVQRLEQIQ